MADVLTGQPGVFRGSPFVPVTPSTKLSKQFYVHFPPWATLASTVASILRVGSAGTGVTEEQASNKATWIFRRGVYV